MSETNVSRLLYLYDSFTIKRIPSLVELLFTYSNSVFTSFPHEYWSVSS